MVNVDQYLTSFISNNWITLTLFLGLLKSVAMVTKNTTDNAIHTLLANLFNQVRGKPPVGVPPLVDRGEVVK
jgi:hypothetical protein